jgi:diaminobutyrate-2-oxoglutarate transaminase
MGLVHRRVVPATGGSGSPLPEPRWGPGSHIGTFRGNNLAFASGNAYLEILRRENLLENVRAEGWHLLSRLTELQRSTRLISDVRGLGLMLGIKMAAYPAASVTAHQVAARVQRAALQRGLIVEIGGREDRVIRLLSPLNVTRRTTDDALAIIASAVGAVEEELVEGGGQS